MSNFEYVKKGITLALSMVFLFTIGTALLVSMALVFEYCPRGMTGPASNMLDCVTMLAIINCVSAGGLWLIWRK